MPTLVNIQAYTLKELRLDFPDAYYRVFYNFYEDGGAPWVEETVHSLKELVDCLYYSLDSYCLTSEYHRSYISCSPPDGNEDVGGVRAYTYIINSLERYRIPYGCRHKNYKDYCRYGRPYRAGNIEPCPFTGYYMDELLIDELLRRCLQGDMLVEALNGLNYLISEILAEDEQQYIEDHYEDTLFTIDGTELPQTK